MTEEPRPEASLPHLRRLARGLLYDRAQAEDVVQEAWLAALRKRPAAERLLGWLGTATKRAAQNVTRSEARRRAREHRAARPEAQPSTLEVSGRIEVLQRVLAALDELAEPYRSAVALRYLEGLPPRVIARRLELPVNTVRTHVRRGLTQLRQSLDRPAQGARRIEREDLLGALLPLAGAPPWGLAAVLSLAGGLAAASVVPWLVLRGPGGAPAEHEPAAGSAARAAPVPNAIGPAAARADQREAVAPSAALTSAWTVVGHVSQGELGPLAGARLELRLGRGLLPERERLLTQPLVSDANGDLHWSGAAPEGAVMLEVELLSSAHVLDPFERHLARQLLWPGQQPAPLLLDAWPLDARLTGTLRDGQGRALAGARVWLEPLGETVSDGAGHFTLATSSQAEASTLRAFADGLTGELELGPFLPGEEHAVALTLLPERRVAGLVRDAHGAPVPGARVWRPYSPEPFALSDEAGRFVLHGLSAEQDYERLVAAAPGFGPTYTRGLLDAAQLEAVELVLAPGVRVRGRVLDDVGAPLADVLVRMRQPESDPTRLAASDEHGEFALEDLPAARVELAFRRAGFVEETRTLDLRAGSAPADLELHLAAARTLAGSVRTEDGQPLPWATLTWSAPGASSFRAQSAGPEGEFELFDLPPGPVRVGASAPGYARTRVELAPDQAGLKLRLARRGLLQGRVLAAESGAPVPEFALRLLAPRLAAGEVEAGPARDTRAFAHAEGRWRLHLDGPVDSVIGLEVTAPGFAPLVLERARLAADPRAELVLALVPATLVRGHVRDAATGAPLEDARIFLRRADGQRLPLPDGSWPRTLADGSFELCGVPAGEVELEIEHAGHAPGRDGPFLLGGQPLEREIELGRGATLRGRLLDEAGAPLADERVFLERPAARFTTTTRTEADGRFVFTALAADEYLLGWERTARLESDAQDLLEGLEDLGYVAGPASPWSTAVPSLLLRDLVTPLHLGAEPRELDLRPRGGATLVGRLSCGAAMPQRVVVRLTPGEPVGSRPARAAWAEDGSFRVPGLEGGAYLLSAEFRDPQGTWRGQAALEVPPQGVANATLTLERVP